MKDYEGRCALCGDVMSKYWMEEIVTGRTTYWLCPKCFKSGARQADHITRRPGHPARREGGGRND